METLAALLYLVASVCFVMALRGLSSPETSRQGNIYGMVGMTVAILTTLALPIVQSYWMIVLGIAIGGGIGYVIARKIEMTALPQLVAAFHSLVGLAAVFVALAAFYSPEAYGIGTAGAIAKGSLVEMALGTAIGAITFTGSLVAFAKLQGLVTGKPLVFPFQHHLNAGLGVLTILRILWLGQSNSSLARWLIVLVALALGFRGRCWRPEDEGELRAYRTALARIIARHDPELAREGGHLFEQAYGHTIEQGRPVRMPHLRPWGMALAALVALFLAGSHALWVNATADLEQALGRIERAHSGPAPDR